MVKFMSDTNVFAQFKMKLKQHINTYKDFYINFIVFLRSKECFETDFVNS